MVELKNIVKKYGNYTAVNDLSFKINTGEIVGFLGPNGAGKSTTMKVISGFLLPDSGDVIIEDRNIKGNPMLAKSIIGYMPENNPLYKDMLVKDSINLALELHSIPKSLYKDKIHEVIISTGLSNVYYKPISELSKGYKQRVGLAQVLIHDPKILILDEPTEGLDPNQRAEIRNLIKDLGQDRTVIISTHVMQEVEAMCSKIIIINKGKLIKIGSKDEITKNTLNESLIKVKLKDVETGENHIKLILNKHIKELDILGFKEIGVEKNVYEFEFSTKDIDKFLSEFTKLVKQNNWILYQLNPEKQNLEELFRELTKD